MSQRGATRLYILHLQRYTLARTNGRRGGFGFPGHRPYILHLQRYTLARTTGCPSRFGFSGHSSLLPTPTLSTPGRPPYFLLLPEPPLFLSAPSRP